jgi:hypothetical protein
MEVTTMPTESDVEQARKHLQKAMVEVAKVEDADVTVALEIELQAADAALNGDREELYSEVDR